MWALGSSGELPPLDDEPDFGWRLSSLPPCRLCDKPIMVAQWITSDGVHHACSEQYPDAMYG